MSSLPPKEFPPAYTSPSSNPLNPNLNPFPNPSPSSNPPSFRTSFSALSLSQTDKIRLINFPPSDISALQSAISQAWARGIQQAKPYGDSHEIKLSGNPWLFHHSTNSIVEPRIFMGKLLKALMERGWVLRGSVDVSVKRRDKDTLLFRYQSPTPPPHDFATLTFHQGDKLLLSSFYPSSNPQVKPSLFPSSSSSSSLPPIQTSLIQALGSKVQSHETHDAETYAIKFHGYPWRAMSEQTVEARVVLIQLLEVLESQGWSLYGSMSLDAGPGAEGRGCDSWVVVRRVGWRVGELVFQS